MRSSFLFVAFCFFIVNACYGDSAIKQSREITDMSGRKLTIPAVVNSVYATSPAGEIMLYTFVPDKICGMTWTLDSDEKSLLLADYVSKPVLGGWFGKNTTGNPEVIIKAHPDIVLSVGNLDNTDISSARRIEEKLGIPVVMVNGKLDSLETTIRFLGNLLGMEKRADTLADYCRSALGNIASTVAKIDHAKRTRVYYAEGLNGLETDPEGSQHTEVLKIAGCINVADVPMIQGYGRAAVSFEQLLVWKPDIILVCLDHGFANGTENFKKITTDKSWGLLDAVKKAHVYQIPSLPFNWIDRPPSLNRIIGLQWLANLLYPDLFKIDIKKETRRFYELFYHKKLSDVELDHVLENSR